MKDRLGDERLTISNVPFQNKEYDDKIMHLEKTVSSQKQQINDLQEKVKEFAGEKTYYVEIC